MIKEGLGREDVPGSKKFIEPLNESADLNLRVGIRRVKGHAELGEGLRIHKTKF